MLKVKTKQVRKNLGKKTADVSTKATLHVPEELKTLASEEDCEQINKLAEKSISAGCASPVKKTPPRQPIQNEVDYVYKQDKGISRMVILIVLFSPLWFLEIGNLHWPLPNQLKGTHSLTK